MILDPKQLSKKDNYKILTGLVIPRPIAWISTVDTNGVYNLAPYSFFNVVSTDPPCVMFCSDRPGGATKDTLRNVLDNKVFVVNLVSEHLLTQMAISAQSFPQGVDEFKEAGLTAIVSDTCIAPRVAESYVSLECKMIHQWSHDQSIEGGATMVIGEVLQMHINESVMSPEYRTDFEQYKAVGRLAGRKYCATVPGVEP